jgi:hypothetical protein
MSRNQLKVSHISLAQFQRKKMNNKIFLAIKKIIHTHKGTMYVSKQQRVVSFSCSNAEFTFENLQTLSALFGTSHIEVKVEADYDGDPSFPDCTCDLRITLAKVTNFHCFE